MTSPRRKSDGGMSLVELLMASIVIGAAGAVLAGGLVAANRSAERRTEQVFLTQLLASRLALLDDRLQPGTGDRGAFPPPLEDYAWSLAVEAAPAPLEALAKATIAVTRRGHTVDVVTYRPLAEP